MLHIHNGDSTANLLREFGLLGEHTAFREVLIADLWLGGVHLVDGTNAWRWDEQDWELVHAV